jgi:hypothetical protein
MEHVRENYSMIKSLEDLLEINLSPERGTRPAISLEARELIRHALDSIGEKNANSN